MSALAGPTTAFSLGGLSAMTGGPPAFLADEERAVENVKAAHHMPNTMHVLPRGRESRRGRCGEHDHAPFRERCNGRDAAWGNVQVEAHMPRREDLKERSGRGNVRARDARADREGVTALRAGGDQ